MATSASERSRPRNRGTKTEEIRGIIGSFGGRLRFAQCESALNLNFQTDSKNTDVSPASRDAATQCDADPPIRIDHAPCSDPP